MTITPPTNDRMFIQALWCPRWDEPSRAYIANADSADRHIAAHVGGHSGVRIDFYTPADVEQLIETLTAALTEYRALAGADQTKAREDR